MENISISEQEYPYITALLVTYNEEQYIEKSLLSLINQTYPHNRYEIIIIDGMSADTTIHKVNLIAQRYKDYEIRILTNEKKILASGWNIGIRAAKGDYVVRIDAHAEAKKNFIEKSVETMLSVPDAVCVGGKLKTISLPNSNDIVSKVLSSPFGVGNSSFRVSDRAGYADTAVYGLYKKQIFDEVGYFNEKFVRNQDIEFHSRIKKYGGKFYFNPEIESVYYARNTVKKMLKQAFGNGKWNMILLKDHSSALSLRHMIPFAFVIYLICSTVGGFICSWLWIAELLVILLHFICGLIAALKKSNGIREVIQMPFLFMMLHISYGLGYVAGKKNNK